MSGLRLPSADLRRRRTTGSLVAIIIALIGVLVALTTVALYLTQPRQLPGAPVSANPLYLYSIYGRSGETLLRPSSVAVDSDGRIVVADTGNARVAVFTAAGGFIESYTGQRPDGIRLISPTSVATAQDGRIFVADSALGGVLVLDRSGQYRDSIVFQQEVPVGVEVVQRGEGDEQLYVTTRSGVVVSTLDGQVQFTYLAFGAADGTFDTPTALVALPSAEPGQPDTVFVDSLNYRVQAFSSFESSPTVAWTYGAPLPPGAALRYAGEDRKFGLPVDIAANDRGELFVVDGLSSQVVILDARTGTFREYLGQPGSRDGTLFMPAGIDYHDGLVYVADKYNDRIEVFADPADPEVVQIDRRQLTPQDLLWLLAVIGLAEVVTFGVIFAMRAPKMVFDLSAVEAAAEGGHGSLIAGGLDAVYAPARVAIIARELLPDVAFSVLEPHRGHAKPSVEALSSPAASHGSSHGSDSGEEQQKNCEIDAFATAAIRLVAEKPRRRVLVTADDTVRRGAESKKLQVAVLDDLVRALESTLVRSGS